MQSAWPSDFPKAWGLYTRRPGFQPFGWKLSFLFFNWSLYIFFFGEIFSSPSFQSLVFVCFFCFAKALLKSSGTFLGSGFYWGHFFNYFFSKELVKNRPVLGFRKVGKIAGMDDKSCPPVGAIGSGKVSEFWLTLQGTNISHIRTRTIIFKSALGWDMLVPRRVCNSV